jgi:hypothetical protein
MHYEINQNVSGCVIKFYLQGELITFLTITKSFAEKRIKIIMLEQHFGQEKTGLLFYFEEELIQSQNPDLVTYWLNQVEEKEYL